MESEVYKCFGGIRVIEKWCWNCRNASVEKNNARGSVARRAHNPEVVTIKCPCQSPRMDLVLANKFINSHAIFSDMGRKPKSTTENTGSVQTESIGATKLIVQQSTSPSISHSPKRMLFTVDRDSLSVDRLRELLHMAGMKHDETMKLLNPMGDADDNYSSIPYSHELYTDRHFHFDRNVVSLMDVIFGRSRIFFVLYSKVLARHLARELGL